MNTSTNDLEKRLAQLKRKVPTRGLERHPSIFRNISDLPAELQSPTVSSIAASEDIQDIISFPQQIHRGHHYVPKQALLFTSTDIIHVVASIWPDQEPEVTYLRGRGLLYIKVTLILLYGYLEIVAQGNTSPARLGVEFNTVAWEQLSRPVRKLLQAAIGAPVTTTGKIIFSQTAQVAVDRLPLKFFNGIRIYGVLPGEELENLVFQPGTWERWLHFFQRPSLANTLILLTSNYMVVIQEELRVSQGWIITYFPRDSIVSILNQLCSQWNELTVHLKKGDQTSDCKILLTTEAAHAWRACWIQHGGQWQDLPGEAG